MSLFSREAIREWAVARAAAKKVETVPIWDTKVDVAKAVQSTPEMALAVALFNRYQNGLPDLSPNDARAELAMVAWDGTGKGYVQMSLDELLDEALSQIAAERGYCSFAGDEDLVDDDGTVYEPDYASLDDFFE